QATADTTAKSNLCRIVRSFPVRSILQCRGAPHMGDSEMGIRGLMTTMAAVAATLALGIGPVGAQQKLVVYTANESTLNDLVFGEFKKKTGVEVEPVAAGSGVLMRRLSAEKAHPLGDIIWGVSRSLLQTNKSYFQPYASANKAATPAEYRDPDDLWIGNNLHLL